MVDVNKLIGGAFDPAMTTLEGFADEFERLANTRELRQLAQRFSEFVGELGKILGAGARQLAVQQEDRTMQEQDRHRRPIEGETPPERVGPPEGRPDAFDRAVANLRRQWRDDGLDATPWRDLPAENKVGYLASFAALHDVPFERFATAARHVLGLEELTADDEWHLRRQFRNAVQSRKGPPARGPDLRPRGGKTSLEQLREAGSDQPGQEKEQPRTKDRDIERER